MHPHNFSSYVYLFVSRPAWICSVIQQICTWIYLQFCLSVVELLFPVLSFFSYFSYLFVISLCSSCLFCFHSFFLSGWGRAIVRNRAVHVVLSRMKPSRAPFIFVWWKPRRIYYWWKQIPIIILVNFFWTCLGRVYSFLPFQASYSPDCLPNLYFAHVAT